MDTQRIPDWLMNFRWEDGTSVEELFAMGLSPTISKANKSQLTDIWRQRQEDSKLRGNVPALEATTRFVDWLNQSSDEIHIAIFAEAKKVLLFDAHSQSSIASG